MGLWRLSFVWSEDLLVKRNKHGLGRHIPADVKREVRQRCKFGCVMCRCGFFHYEHIDPEFEDAETHDPDRICCLCGACHDRVSKGLLSKSAVESAYAKIQGADIDQVGHPIGPLDFHDGTAELVIGGLEYSPAIRTVLRYYGKNLITVKPGSSPGEPGSISAVFTDNDGAIVLELRENEWVGSLEAWDIEVVGQVLTVRQRKGHIALQIRLDPPGRVVVERLDMRIGKHHLLADENTYAVGWEYEDKPGVFMWMHAAVFVDRSLPFGCVIDISTREDMSKRAGLVGHGRGGSGWISTDRRFFIHSTVGCMVPELGIAIGAWTEAMGLYEMTIGPKPLSGMRGVLIRKPERLAEYIVYGRKCFKKSFLQEKERREAEAARQRALKEAEKNRAEESPSGDSV